MYIDYELSFFHTARGNCPAAGFISSLQARPRTKISAWLERLRELGPDLPRPYADVLKGPIRELRVSFGGLRIRLLYFISDRTIIVTHGFIKKTPAVPVREIELAQRYRIEWLATHRGANT